MLLELHLRGEVLVQVLLSSDFILYSILLPGAKVLASYVLFMSYTMFIYIYRYSSYWLYTGTLVHHIFMIYIYTHMRPAPFQLAVQA